MNEDLAFIYNKSDLDLAFNAGAVSGKQQAERSAVQVLTALVLTNGGPLTASAEAMMDVWDGYVLERTESIDTRAIVFSVRKAQEAA